MAAGMALSGLTTLPALRGVSPIREIREIRGLAGNAGALRPFVSRRLEGGGPQSTQKDAEVGGSGRLLPVLQPGAAASGA